MAGLVQIVPAHATVIIFGLSSGLPQQFQISGEGLCAAGQTVGQLLHGNFLTVPQQMIFRQKPLSFSDYSLHRVCPLSCIQYSIAKGEVEGQWCVVPMGMTSSLLCHTVCPSG